MKKENLVPGKEIHGFIIKSVSELVELASRGINCRHKETGCRIYHIANDDPENAFAFVFRTPPRNSTGVAHILEHSVLCGSKRFPLKDPFALLLKGSMNTYLNAWTYPDKTVYPAASINARDYYHIMQVYGDAVFFPLLKEEIFMQEAHHLEYVNPDDRTSPLTVIGVVYNEMKGNYSSQSSIVSDWTIRSLFPDTPYGVDSGGDPEEIISLTHQDLCHFHARYYHPSNCKILLYGNIQTTDQLKFLETQFLSNFHGLSIDSSIPIQKRSASPFRFVKGYPVTKGESLVKKTEVTLSWLLPQVTDSLLRTAFIVLGEILAGNAGSPLRRAMVESGLGQDYSSSCGLETDLREMVFTTGLRGTDKALCDKIEACAFGVLGELARSGIPAELFESALHRVEFRTREISGSPVPYGLKLFQRALHGFLHDAEPEETLLAVSCLEALKERLKAEPRFLENLIFAHLLENKHRSTVIVEPDPDYMTAFEQSLAQKIKTVEAGLDAGKRKELNDKLGRLISFQQTPNSPEDVKKLPFLSRGDLPKRVTTIECLKETIGDSVPLSIEPMHTNGIVYVDLAFRTDDLVPDLVPFLPLYGRAVCGMGLPGKNYAQVQQELSLLSGGFFALTDVGLDVSTQQTPGHLIFRVKMLESKTDAALGLVTDLLTRADLADQSRLADILFEQKNSLAASIIPRGSAFAMLRAARRFSGSIAKQEMMEGVSQYLFLNQQAHSFSSGKEKLMQSLAAVRDFIIRSAPLTVNLACAASAVAKVKPALEKLSGAFSKKLSGPAAATGVLSNDFPAQEALVVSSSVGFVARAFAAAGFGTPEYAVETVLGHLLDTGILHEKVRVRGGAYGAMSFPFRQEGVFIFASYRDPHIVSTLDAFLASLKTISDGQVTVDDLDKAVIGCVARDEIPLRPNEKGFVCFRRLLYGIDDRLRQRQRERLLALTPADLQAHALKLMPLCAAGATAVVAGKEMLAKAREENPALSFVETVLPL